jgi:hypothetical protein
MALLPPQLAHAIGALAAVLGAALLAVLSAAAPALAGIATSTTVSVEPPTVLEPYTPATFRASVTPSDAVGFVNFTFDGEAFGTAPVVSGSAVFESSAHTVGVHQLQASFVPQAGSGFSPSVSPAIPVTVNAVARLILSRPDGSLVPPGSQLRIGEQVTINALGYPATSTVRFTLAGQALPQTITTNASGSGTAPLVVSSALPSAVYQLVGQANLRNAAFVFYVYNPPPAATPGPTATAPVGAGSGSAGGSTSGSTGGSAGIPSTGGGATGDLAATGSDTAPLMAWGGLALGVGAGLVSIGGSPRASGGRHVRR